MNKFTSGAKILFYAAVLAVVTFWAFSATANFGLINVDDYDYLVETPTVFGVENAIWMPLTWLSYQLESSLGFDYGMMHLTNVGIHAANVVLLFALLLAIFPKRPILAFLAAFFWAVHPLRVESVAWLSSRKDVLSTFFFLLALLAWVKSNRWGLCIAIALVAVGATAKPSVMLFPIFAALIDFAVIGRRKPWWAYGVIVVLAGAIAIESVWAQGAGDALSELAAVPLWYRIGNALAAITVYLGNEFTFSATAPECLMRWPSAPMWSPVGAALLLIAAYYLWQGRLLSVRAGLLAFLIALGPFLGIIGFGIHAFADRFTILPALALSIAAIPLIEHAVMSRPLCERAIFLVMAFAGCELLFVQTRTQTSYWENDDTLFSHAVKVDGEANYLAQSILAGYHYEYDHDMEKVYSHYSKISEADWEHCGINGLMYIESMLATGRKDKAEEFYQWLLGWETRLMRKVAASPDRPLGFNPNRGLLVCKLANVLRLSCREDPDLRKYADDEFAKIKKSYPKHHNILNVEYRLAILAGRDGEAERRAAQDCVGDNYMKNRWAFKE